MCLRAIGRPFRVALQTTESNGLVGGLSRQCVVFDAQRLAHRFPAYATSMVNPKNIRGGAVYV
jgi:hypothetical protein